MVKSVANIKEILYFMYLFGVGARRADNSRVRVEKYYEQTGKRLGGIQSPALSRQALND